jgi:hypothetical protein
MITILEEHKLNLLSRIEKLKRKIDGLKWLEHKELALCNRTGTIRSLVPDRLWEHSRN